MPTSRNGILVYGEGKKPSLPLHLQDVEYPHLHALFGYKIVTIKRS